MVADRGRSIVVRKIETRVDVAAILAHGQVKEISEASSHIDIAVEGLVNANTFGAEAVADGADNLDQVITGG